MKILVIGNFGYTTNQLDGQTIKTRSVYELFKKSFQDEVSFFDTQSLKKTRFGLLKLLVMMAKANMLIILPAQNSLKFIFPIIVFFKQLFRFRVYYFVVGGWLVKYLKNNKKITFLLKKIDGIFTETALMKKELRDSFSIEKVCVFPNFRNIESEIIKVPEKKENKLKLVFYSRINKLKGIDIIIDFMKSTTLDITIDFYGPIFQDDKTYFENRIQDVSNIKYKGVLNSETAYLTLSQYDLLILPTQYSNIQ
jgi:glycosyltransferase involved in cell wall biosynthesis